VRLFNVVPTPVGMDRRILVVKYLPPTLSPRPWGWTAVVSTSFASSIVVPTPVGMDPERMLRDLDRVRCPHARGDGPPAPMRSAISPPLSPRPWGWTVVDAFRDHDARVVPTPVGMDRSA